MNRTNHIIVIISFLLTFPLCIIAQDSSFDVQKELQKYDQLNGKGRIQQANMLFAEYDKDIYKGEFTCTDSEAGKMQQQEVWGEMREVYAVTPTKDCTVNFNLVYAPKTITIGDKEVSAADGETDVFGDGSVIVDKGDIQITGANISGDIVSPYSNTWIKASGTNNITGNITADSFMSIFCWDDEPAIFNIAGSISCTSAVANDYNGQILDLSNVEIFISSPANSKDMAKAMGTSVSAISGFEDINYDSEEFVIAQPLNGHYDTTKKMLVDADGNPSAVFCLMTKGHYTTGVTSPSTSSQNSTTVKYIQDGQIIITRNSRNYNTVGIEMR